MKKFITFEGIDGSGKSTVLTNIYQHLLQRNCAVKKTFEPTDTWLGRCVQHCIKTKTDPFITAFTFSADRIQHGKKIQQWLDNDYIVLCDRYAESTYAYQGVQLSSCLDDPITWLQELTIDQIPLPDRIFVFMIDPKIAIARIQHRDELIPFEQIEFLIKVQENYEKLIRDDRFLVIDAEKPIKDIVSICVKDIFQDTV